MNAEKKGGDEDGKDHKIWLISNNRLYLQKTNLRNRSQLKKCSITLWQHMFHVPH